MSSKMGETTVSVTGAEVLPMWVPSPEYAAVMVWVPMA